nr:Rieske 2Fe-2S domain-containing protein [Roseovarius sp. EL26]
MAAKQPGLPAYDTLRTNGHRWLAVWVLCPKGDCVALTKTGEYDGFFCPCCGSHYDMAGRFRKGPTPRNMEAVPVLLTEDGKHFVLDLAKTPKAIDLTKS